jgi:hypothetical protein
MKLAPLLIAAISFVAAITAKADKIIVYQGTGSEQSDAFDTNSSSNQRVKISNNAYAVLDIDSGQILFIYYANSLVTKTYYPVESQTKPILKIAKAGLLYDDFLANANVGNADYVEVLYASGPLGNISLPNWTKVSGPITLAYQRTISNLTNPPQYFAFRYNLSNQPGLTQKVNGGTFDDAKAAVIGKLTKAGYTEGK